MDYISTRNHTHRVSSAEAIVAGLSPDGGLFIPESFPQFTLAEIEQMAKTNYMDRATDVLSRFLTDFTRNEIRTCIANAYGNGNFPTVPAPIVSLNEHTHILELFHGPTCAFKDFALQLLPFLLTASLKKTGTKQTAVILVATSGDTGKAALEGFSDVEGTKICVFYPDGGTSSIQRRQMVTQAGDNVMVFATKGNFDDAQSGVKAIFMDTALCAELDQKGFLLSSANSINWGRLVPQIAYYFSAYCDLLHSKKIKIGDRINVTVPTGNFGNILAAYFAKQCGLPIAKFICASNRNNVLTDFIETGSYDRNRNFYLTASPSMDILISSNLERLLYLLCERDDLKVRRYMKNLACDGLYTVEPSVLAALQAELSSGYANDNQTMSAIRLIHQKYNYLCDTHTAVAYHVYDQYVSSTGDKTPTIIASTASPYKFASSVLPAAFDESPSDNDFELLEQLSVLSKTSIPEPLSALKDKEEHFHETILPSEMKQAVLRWLLDKK